MKNYHGNASSIQDKCIAERAVRRIKEGTSVVLSQSGLDEKNGDSMEGYCYL